jgi:hypothetical protein
METNAVAPDNAAGYGPVEVTVRLGGLGPKGANSNGTQPLVGA